MKFGTIASLCVAATLGAAQAAPFDTLLSLVQQLQDEATALSTEYAAKDDEIAALMAQLTSCGGDDDADGAEEEDTPAPAATTASPVAPAPRPTPEPTPAVTTAPRRTSEPTPVVTPVPEEPEEPEEPEPSTPTSGGFTFAIGNSWNYNLASPYNVDIDVDVFFIDMGELVVGGLVCYSSIDF